MFWYPETKELVGGFDVIDFDSEQEAGIAFAKYEEAHRSLVTEVRPIREFWWISQTLQAASKMFMLTSVEDERASLSLPESERTKIMRQHEGVGAEYVASRAMLNQEPGLWVGARLQVSEQAETDLRWKNGGRLVTDGPFAETKEVAGGFNLVACASIDEAITWANKLMVRAGDAIEVRPVDGCWWVYHE